MTKLIDVLLVPCELDNAVKTNCPIKQIYKWQAFAACSVCMFAV